MATSLGIPLGGRPPQVLSKLAPPPPKAVADVLGVTSLSIDWLAGDGSDRCYFRVRSPEKDKSYVLMQLSGIDLENLRAGNYDWIEISSILNEYNILAPKPVAILKDFGALLIDDYGDEMLETEALRFHRNGNLSQVLPHYTRCLDILRNFIAIRPAGSPSWMKRSFDEARFLWELDFFVTKYLEGVCRRPLTTGERTQFDQDSRALARFLANGSKYFVHRDFHSRNVMVVGEDVAVIDFQDARLGPVSYDLVSLCFDSYVPFTGSQRLELLEQGLDLFGTSQGPAISTEARAQWKPMLLQRQIKAIGSFGYLTIDKLKGDYLKNVAPAVQTLVEAKLVDNRWPFISGTLVEILAANLPTSAGTGAKA